MKILIVGGGGREHAIAWKVSQSDKVEKIYCAPGNAGIGEYAQCVDIGVMEFDRLAAFAREKEIDLAVIGSAPLDQGVSITASHIDSPRLDLKPTPLYEDSELAFFKTHYYGGIRKYQWVTIPLELHGVIRVKERPDRPGVHWQRGGGPPVYHRRPAAPFGF